MLLQVPNVLTTEQVAQFRQALDQVDWADGRITAGYQSSQAKHNLQLPEESAVAQQLGEMVLTALQRSPLFLSAALPLKVFPPLFNRYEGGQSFGSHVDNAVRQIRGTPHRVRTDLSATLFLSPPTEYDGGELVSKPLTFDGRRRRHLRHAQRQVASGRPRALSGQQPAPGPAGDPGRTSRIVLLGPEHGPRRRTAHAVV